MKRISWILPALLLVLTAPLAVRAGLPFDPKMLTGQKQAASPEPQKKTLTEDEIRELKKQNAAELEQARQGVAKIPESGPQEQKHFLNARIQTLDGLDLMYGDILESLTVRSKIIERFKALETEFSQWRTGIPPKDFQVTFNALDKLRGQEVEAKRSQKSREQIYKSRQDAHDDAKKEFHSAEQERRKAKEALESTQEGEARVELEAAFSLAQLKSRYAETRLLLRELEFEVSKIYRDFFQTQEELTQLKMDFLEKRVKFTEDDLKGQLDKIDAESARLGQDLEKSQKDLVVAKKDYDRLRTKLSENPNPPDALIEETEAKRLDQVYLDLNVELLTDGLKRLKELREFWRQRYQLLNGQVNKSDLVVWQQQTKQYLEQLNREDELSDLRLNSWRNTSAENDAEVRAKVDADADTRSWLQIQKEEIQKNIGMLQNYQASLLVDKKLFEKFLAEQEALYSHVSLAERLSRLWEKFVAVWNFEFTSVDDSPITVSKVFFAFVLMLVGLLLARKLSAMLAERVLPRFGVTPGVAAALRTLSFYALVLLFVLTALHLVKVPLTLFAVLGGAIAIGLGFGSQNLMNNFISGLILLIERPIKVGDIVEMEGNTGVVEQIGGRSTQIRTFSNIHMIVPNSAFLEKNVVNWTLSDNLIRSVIRVGVDYDSSTRQVADLLKKSAMDHGKVLEDPEPIVIFHDFGPDSLIFDLYFWMKIQTTLERKILESDLRFMIEGTFEEAGIRMAYQQRDVHLDAKEPLPVRVVKE